eukprot:CAMPEP_0117655570 /NCGR_PEP_ID=MMETSP0804-20121206/4348_1 /TAXON_ID=1074897 /ORGANISM="Tetraselmis astigmatica, Strain CCMP880" /LENGTH=79 /DNA_ID=CAMNT_0005461927 /DNA_START=190 /DNA_END=426 /DNA_ORIENTATION=+
MSSWGAPPGSSVRSTRPYRRLPRQQEPTEIAEQGPADPDSLAVVGSAVDSHPPRKAPIKAWQPAGAAAAAALSRAEEAE